MDTLTSSKKKGYLMTKFFIYNLNKKIWDKNNKTIKNFALYSNILLIPN